MRVYLNDMNYSSVLFYPCKIDPFPPCPVFIWAGKVHSCPLFNIVFPPLLLLLPLLFPFTVPCRVVFAKPEDLEAWEKHLNFHFLTRVSSSSDFPMAAWIFLRISSFVIGTCRKYSKTFGCISPQRQALFSLTLLSRSTIHRHTEIWKWQGSAPDPRDILLSLKIGFSLVRIALACAVLDRTYGIEPHLRQLTQDTWSSLQYQKSPLLSWSPSGCHWHYLSSVWFFFQHWSPSYTLCWFCWGF